jgi:hypothetical protein
MATTATRPVRDLTVHLTPPAECTARPRTDPPARRPFTGRVADDRIRDVEPIKPASHVW